MNLDVKRDNNGRIGTGLTFHKTGGIKSSHTKRQAMIDISKCCGDDFFFSRNYVNCEYHVLLSTKINLVTRTLNLNEY